MSQTNTPSGTLKCLYCGNNPSDHLMDRVMGFFNGLTAPVNERILYSYPGRCLMFCVDKGLGILSLVWFPLGIAKWNSDSSKSKIARGRVIWEEAEKRGIKMQQLMVFGKATDIYRAKLHGKWKQFTSLPRPEVLESQATAWIDDKAILKEKLYGANIPISKGAGFFSYDDALAFFRLSRKPVVVKPRFGSRGRHTTTFVNTEEDFKEAFRITKRICPYVMVEEQLTGPVYRATAIAGRVRGLLAGEPPRITGDGVSTIMELIKRKDAEKKGEVKDVPVHALFDSYLKRRSLSRDAVLPKGHTIDLTEKIGVSYGGKSIEVIDIVHPKFIPILNYAAQFVGDPLLGFDFIAPDITKDPASQRWGIIECNAVPFVNLHHEPLEGKPSNVAGAIWDMMEAGV